jgi:hypothetical protein
LPEKPEAATASGHELCRTGQARFAIEIERCWRYGGSLRVIASTENEAVVEWILDHQ